MNILNKLLWKRKTRWQIIGAAAGALVGLLLLLNAIQLYVDLKDLLEGNSNSNDHFVQINKKVNLFNTLGVKSTFSEAEIENIHSQKFVKSIGIFTPNQFKVSASSQLLGFYTELFFEALPDNFLDVKESRFRWKKGQNELPVILSRDYLALYNFGFAPSQGLPQFTQNTIKRVSMDINVSGNGLRKTFQGRIVGFSDRINSILVPQSFMKWANETFGSGTAAGSSRLIMAVDNPLSHDLTDFLKENNYEISSGRLIGGQFAILLNIVISAIAAIGFIIVLLSVLIFILNFQLIISKSSEDIRLLLQLGYKPTQISTILTRNLSILFAVVIALTILLLLVLRSLIVGGFGAQGFALAGGLHWSVYLTGLLFSVLFLVVNYRNIRRNVLRLF